MPTKTRSKKSAEDRTSAAQWIAGISALTVIALVLWLWNKKTYPEVSSPDGLHLIRALYTACSSQSSERLAQVEKRLLAVDTLGRINEAERTAFHSIIAEARAGDWTEATDASYQFAQDQVR